MRSLKILSVLLVLVGLGSADSKIKTRKTMMGQTMESTVYVKGARQRTETAGMMGMPGTTTIVQCDQKRIITLNTCTKTYMVTSMDQMAGAAMSPGAAMASAEAADRGAPQKGGVLTIVNEYIDTKERQKMFGLEARHIRTTTAVEPSPDACQKQGVKMERDGWYVSLSPQFTCDAGVHQYAAMGGGGRGPRPSCRDTVRMKGGMSNPGFPLKETMTFMSEGHPFTMTEEVTELSTANLNPALFDIPVGYREVSDYRAMMGDPRAMMSGGGASCSSGIPIEVAGAPAEAAPAAPPAATPPAAAPAPKVTSVPAKASGTLRVGVVKIADKSGAYLPVINLRLNLMYEVSLKKIEPIPLDAETQKDALDEGREKSCDYVLFTDATAIGDPGQPAPQVPGRMVKAAAVNPANYNARLDIVLWKPQKPQPELKEAIPGTAPVRAVDAVMNGFENEAAAVREQIDKDLHPSKATPAKAPAHHPVKKN